MPLRAVRLQGRAWFSALSSRSAIAIDLLVRACRRAFWEVDEPRACLVRVAHQAAYLLPAVSQRRGVAGISVDGDLRNGKPYGLGFRH
jgi:hypothetical protein